MATRRFDAFEMEFSKGEEMFVHEHDYDHYIVVLAGSIWLLGDKEWTVIATTRIDFSAGHSHGWRALEDGTIVLGIYPQNAKPAVET